MGNFYEQLKNVCKEHNTTIYAVEKATGASKGSFIKWRNSSPSMDKLIEIANLLGVSMDYLIGREIPQTKKSPTLERLDNDMLSIENIKLMLAENDGLNLVENLYNELKEQRQKVYVILWLIKYLESEGLPAKQILGK